MTGDEESTTLACPAATELERIDIEDVHAATSSNRHADKGRHQRDHHPHDTYTHDAANLPTESDLSVHTTSTSRQKLNIVLALTFATGIVDAVSYFSLDHVFTANMSGNIALLGIGAATDLSDVLGNVFAFVGFVAGSALVARLFRSSSRGRFRQATRALRMELGLLISVTATLATFSASGQWSRYVICLLLAAAMGVQTGIARLLRVEDVNTTVATMTLHDLVAASRVAGGDSVRWRRRTFVIAGLFGGAAVGVLLDSLARWGGLALTCVIVSAVLIYANQVAESDGLAL